MQINATTDYAVRILINIARARGPVSSTQLSSNIAVSKRYLMFITAKLRDAGLIAVRKGTDGGYFIPSSPEDITLYEIIVICQGPVKLTHDNSMGEDKDATKNLHAVYGLMQRVAEDFLKYITLKDLIVAEPFNEGDFLLDLFDGLTVDTGKKDAN